MIWIVAIIMGALLYKLGVLTVLVAILALALKAALFVIIVLEGLFTWRWIKNRREQKRRPYEPTRLDH